MQRLVRTCRSTVVAHIGVASFLRDAGLVCTDRLAKFLRDGCQLRPQYAQSDA